VQFKLRQLSKRLFTSIDDRLLTGLILILIAVLLSLSGALVRFDNLYYDLGRYLTFKQAPADIVIVAIDEASLNDLGRWPWSRTVHAALVNKLKIEQARVIGLDIVFSEPELSDPDADLVLAESIGQAKNVVLPVLFEVPLVGVPVKQSLPLAILAENAAGIGRVHVPLDADGMARSIYLWEGLSFNGFDVISLPHFAESVLKVAKLFPDDVNATSPKLHFDENPSFVSAGLMQSHLVWQDARKINFSGPPGHFQRISYAKVLSGDYPAGFFKNKIVLVGATAVGMGDILPTPISALSQPMSGVEFNANVIEAMRHSGLVVDAPLYLICIFCALLAIVPLLWLPKLTPFKSLLAIILYVLVVISVTVSMPHFINVWMPPTGALSAILLAYPIWSWRKLDSVQVFFDSELQHLRYDLALNGVEQATLIENANEDPFHTRISKVRLMTKHLRDLQRDRSDTLAFISHDIRAPLATAIMLLSESEHNESSRRIIKMLSSAHDMAENFLQASRAEMADVTNFQVLDFLWVVQQALDDVYEVAREKHITLDAHFPDSSLWVLGDFGLLQRAILNILLNAVKYSPVNSSIQIRLAHTQQMVVLNITNAGPGIPPDKIVRLFKRFSRIEGEHQAPEGSGLGLYFVDVIIKKHHGEIFVTSELGQFTTFKISLPLEKFMEKDSSLL
jgi:CHASE2 domain-containing sensor protein/nitrogen-specific signal transduction histidine kinase